MKWVGKSVPKIDGVAIATGKPLYTEDLVVPGALTVKLLRSPPAFARILSIDTAAAQALVGVAHLHAAARVAGEQVLPGRLQVVRPELFHYQCRFVSLLRRSPAPSRAALLFQQCLAQAHGLA